MLPNRPTSSPMSNLDTAYNPSARPVADTELTPSGGLLNWWYRFAAPRVTTSRPSLAERELVRRGRLAATLILAILVLGVINLPVAALNPSPSELYGDIAGLIGCGVALALNRSGSVGMASLLLAALLDVGFAAIILTSPGGLSVPNLLLMPLLALAELIAVSLLAPWTVFLVALINSAFVLIVILEWPADATLRTLLNEPGAASLIISPPITLYLIVALVTYLWVRGATNALIARDRAEELAGLEHSVAEQRRNLEVGMREMHDTLVRVANGDFSARAPIGQDNVLWQLSAALNTMIARQQKVADSQYQMQRASAEVSRVIEAVRQARAGRPPLWPAETGTILDPLIRELSGNARGTATSPGMPPQIATPNPLAAIPGLGPIPGLLSAPEAIPGPAPIQPIPPGWDGSFSTEPLPPPAARPNYPPSRGGSPFDPYQPEQGYSDQSGYGGQGYAGQGEYPDQGYPDLGGALPTRDR